jgi:hypothetical protein
MAPSPFLARHRALAWAAAGVALAAAAGIGAQQLAGDPQECPGHWHSTFLVVMDGHVVHYGRPVFYSAPDGVKDFDLHADDQVMHYHPQFRDRCVPVSRFLLHLGIRPTDSGISFDENFGANAGTYRDNATHHLEVHYQAWNSTWRQVRWSDVSGLQMGPGDKLLLTYGALTPEAVAAQKDLVRDLPDVYLPPEHRRGLVAEAPDEHAAGSGTAAPG